MPRKRPDPRDPFNLGDNPILGSPTGRLMVAFATLGHGYENAEVISALLQFTSSLLLTQIVPSHRGRMVDKYCDDLIQMVSDKEADLRAAHPDQMAPQAKDADKKAKKARSVRRAPDRSGEKP